MEQNKKDIYYPKNLLSAGAILNIIREMLSDINPIHIDLSERTCYMTFSIIKKFSLEKQFDHDTVLLLTLFFSIGAYKYDELEKIDDYIQKNTTNTTTYAYLFLRYMTPLKNKAETIFLQKNDYETAKRLTGELAEYASLIFTCAKLCIKLKKNAYMYDADEITKTWTAVYNRKYLDMFFEADKNGEITGNLKNRTFFEEVTKECNSNSFDYDDTFMLLKMMIYAIDFRSTSTVTHIISTSGFAGEIGQRMGMTETEIDELFAGAILHDIGKMAVDPEILEFAGKLSDEQMAIMKSHVDEGERIYRGLVSEKIADIAARHHEKLDGSGYPNHLKAEDLTPQQRLMAVADISSALTDARTYKTSFPKEKTIAILQDMAAKNQLDSQIVKTLVDDYDEAYANVKLRNGMLTGPIGNIMMGSVILDGYTDLAALLDNAKMLPD